MMLACGPRSPTRDGGMEPVPTAVDQFPYQGWRDGTHVRHSGSEEPWPLDHQGIPFTQISSSSPWNQFFGPYMFFYNIIYIIQIF